MSKTTNQIILHKDYAIIVVTKSGDSSYLSEVLVDKEDLQKIEKIRVTTRNYAFTCGVPSVNLAHLVMGHISNMKTVVDHINGNTLDNRKSNLRIVSAIDNANNRNTTPRNNTGVVGISFRVNGGYEYYRATVSDRKTPMSGAKSKTKQYSKQFNINKLGKEVAFLMAKEWLDSKKKEFGYLP